MELQTSGKLAKKCCQNCASYKKPRCYNPAWVLLAGNNPIYVARKHNCEYHNTDKAAAGQNG
jgi:hypothetical protein